MIGIRRATLILATMSIGVLATACTSSGRGASPDTPHATPPATGVTSGSPDVPGSGVTRGDWPTYHGTGNRAGVSTSMPAVHGAPRAVATVALDASVYASPIVVGGRTIAATENDTVYAFDGRYRQLWKRTLGTPARRSELPCGNIDPSGITGTPVYDATSRSIYVVAEHGNPVSHELVALGLDGAVHWRRPIDLPGTSPDAMQERGALTVSGGRVWVPFGGRDGDCGDYKGRVEGVRLNGVGPIVSYTVPTAREAGIWTPPGPSVGADGHLLVAVGNGASGVGDAYDHSDSVLELDTSGALVDSYSPSTWPSDNDADLDLGSQGPALVGSKWVFAAGKSGTAYVLRQGHLGGIGGEVSMASVCRSFGGTAVVGSTVYVPCSDGGLAAVAIDSSGNLRVLWHASEGIDGSPVVGGGRVWSLDTAGGDLHGLDPTDGKSLGSVQVGVTNRFATPAITGNDVIVPTLAGFTVVRTS